MKHWLVSVLLCVLLLAFCGTALATDIFIATNGNDGNPGTITQPLATLHQAVLNASAGDTIYFRAGSYNQNLYWDFGANGSAGNYITIQAYDGDLTATMYNTEELLSLFGRTYVKVIGMEFRTGSNVVHIHGGAHHVYVQRCYIHDGGAEADLMKGNQSDYVYVEDCELKTPGIRYQGGYQECIDYVDVDYAEMKRNYCHDFGNMAWYSKGGSEYTVIEANIASTQISSDWDPAVGFGGQTDTEYLDGATYQSYNLVMRNNIIRNVPGGAVGTYDCYHGYFYNNLIHNAGGGINEIVQQRTSCLCLSPPTGPPDGDGQTTGFYFFNNVVLDTRGQMPTVFGDRSGTYSDWQTGNNNYYNNGSAIPSDGIVNPNTESGATFTNPNLANPTGSATTWAGWKNCYRITASSSALIDHGNSSAGNTPYPAVATDMDGVSRPQGSAYDIGPFEYVGGGGGAPVANFTGTPTSGAAPLVVAFTDSSTNTPTSWSWNFGDSSTSTAQSPSHTYNSVSSYTVSLRATNASGYDDEVKTNYITVNPAAPVAAFSGAPTTGTAPLAVTFTDASTNSPTSWSWNFGDTTTSTSQNPSHTYVNAGAYTVSLRATNAGGFDDEVKTNYITASVGSATPTFVAAGAVASNAAAITPALPAGIVTNDILLLFLETANQAISIANQNGGTWAAVTNSPQGTGTAGGTAATRVTAFWSRYNGTQGAPTTSDSGNHQLGRILAVRGCVSSGNPWDVSAGGVEATVDTSGSIPGATTTVSNTLVVAAIATALPDASGTANFSAWTNANLTSVTERTDNTITAGNGGGLAVATGAKAAAGAYGSTAVTCGTATAKGLLSIALKSGGGGGGSAPVANFSGTPTSGAAPLSVSFTDSSTNTPTSWSWNFGDSATSTAQNPSHSYAAGTYTVSLRATNAYGYDDEVKTNYITATVAPPVANFTGTPTSGAAPLSVSFSDSSTNGPTAWSWNFGDSTTSTAQNPSHSYAAGTYTVSLRATNAGGYDDEVKTNYITATSGGGEVYVYPYTVSSYHTCATIAGSLSDTQTDNNVYHQVRCDTSSHQYSQIYVWDTTYTPSQVNKITVEWQWHGSRSDTPLYSVLFAKPAGGYTQILDSLASPTSDYTFSWETTAISTYMNASGVMEVRMCGCNQNSNNYDTYNDVVRIKLTLN
jgi:PKD repeat protein